MQRSNWKEVYQVISIHWKHKAVVCIDNTFSICQDRSGCPTLTVSVTTLSLMDAVHDLTTGNISWAKSPKNSYQKWTQSAAAETKGAKEEAIPMTSPRTKNMELRITHAFLSYKRRMHQWTSYSTLAGIITGHYTKKKLPWCSYYD